MASVGSTSLPSLVPAGTMQFLLSCTNTECLPLSIPTITMVFRLFNIFLGCRFLYKAGIARSCQHHWYRTIFRYSCMHALVESGTGRTMTESGSG